MRRSHFQTECDPPPPLALANATAEVIRTAIFGLGIENAGSAVADVVTVSIGVCCRHPHSAEDNEEFVREADMALYAAKYNGRNQVQTASPSLPEEVGASPTRLPSIR